MSSEGFLVRFLLGLTATLAAGWLAVGCAASQRHEGVLGAGQVRGSWASPAELAWLTKLGSWNTALVRGLQRRASTESTASVPLRSCELDLLNNVGSPPTSRLERAFGTFRRACRHLPRRDATSGRLLLQADQMLPPGELRSLPIIAGYSAESRVEPRFGQVASALAGKDVEVRCWSKPDWLHLIREEQAYTHGRLGSDTLGFAGIGGSRINLGPDVCTSLARFSYRAARPTDDAGRELVAAAVVTLSHEPQHTKGIAQEALAECNAIQVAQRTAMKLGASRTYAESLVRMYWRHYGAELSAYRSPECRRGGSLDLGYADSIWP